MVANSTERPELPWRWLGRLPYEHALLLQRARREEILAGNAASELWLLEHDPVITTGRRAAEGLPPREFLASRGVDFFETERGGLATYHGPGQLVGYLLCRVEDYNLTVKSCVDTVEAALIQYLQGFGLEPRRREGYPGVWIGRDKIAAIGMNFSHGVSMHGFALNLRTELEPYTWFVPCGIRDGGVTRLADLVKNAPDPEQAATEVGESLKRAFAGL